MMKIDSMTNMNSSKNPVGGSNGNSPASQSDNLFTLEIYNPRTRLEIYRGVTEFLSAQGFGKTSGEILLALQDRHSRVWEQGAGRCVVTVFETGALGRSAVMKARLLFQEADGRLRKPERKCFLFFVKPEGCLETYRRLAANLDDLIPVEDLNPKDSGLALRENLRGFLQDQLKVEGQK